MQTHGNIEEGEDTLATLHLEQREKIGLDIEGCAAVCLDRLSELAANQTNDEVAAVIYHIHVKRASTMQSEIEGTIWGDPSRGSLDAVNAAIPSTHSALCCRPLGSMPVPKGVKRFSVQQHRFRFTYVVARMLLANSAN